MAKRKTTTDAKAKAGLITLKLDGSVTLQRLGQALDYWTDFLREVGREVSGVDSREPVRYIVAAAKGGSLSLGVRPQSAHRQVSVSVLPRIAKTVTAGLKSLERSAKRPRHFSDVALERVRDLAALRGAEIPDVLVGNGVGDPLALSTRMVKHVDAVLAPEIESIGTVEGHLEGLIIHGKRRFLIFDQATGRQVTCYFTDKLTWEAVLQAFGRRVAASGIVRSRRGGETVSVHVHRLYIFPPDAELPTADDVRGILRMA